MTITKKILSIVAVAVSFFFVSVSSSFAQQQKLVVYIQDGCSHCANLEAFVTRNNLNDKVEYRDIRRSETASKELTALFEKYLPGEAGGTPAMEADGQLYPGDTPIIDYLKKTYNIVDDTPIAPPATTAPETKPLSGSDIAFLGIGALVLIGIVGYGIYSGIKKN